MVSEAEAGDALRRTGRRRTASRLLVLSILSAAGRHMTAGEVVEKARARARHISPSTVYRSLGVLRDAGVVTETLMPGGETLYEWSDASAAHHHLACRECGSTTDLAPEFFEGMAERLLARYGFRADLTHIALHGVCASCAARAPRTLSG